MILSVMMIFLLERILPASRTTKGVENSIQALYSAQSATENILTSLRQDNPGGVIGGNGNITLAASGESTSSGSRIIDSSNILPAVGKGNSEGDENWSIIGPRRPVQLQLNSTMLGDGSGIRIEFRLPQFGSSDIIAGTSSRTQPELVTDVVVGFSLSNGTTGLAMESECEPGEKKGFNSTFFNATSPLKKSLAEMCIKPTSGVAQKLSDYLTANPTFCTPTCTLKFSVLRTLKNINGEILPYVEYRVRGAGDIIAGKVEECFTKYKGILDLSCGPNFYLVNPIPTQTATIISEAQKAGFKKVITKSYDQLTTSEGLDFTVFQ